MNWCCVWCSFFACSFHCASFFSGHCSLVFFPFMPAFGLKIYYFLFSMFVPNSFFFLGPKTRFLFSIFLPVFFIRRVTRASPSLNQQSSAQQESNNKSKRSGEKATNNNTDWNFCVCHELGGKRRQKNYMRQHKYLKIHLIKKLDFSGIISIYCCRRFFSHLILVLIF